MALLQLTDVCKNYPKFNLKNVSFSVAEGSITGFIGRNGAGKTTTLKGIMGLIHLDGGSIKFFDKEFNKENENEIRQNVSLSLSELDYFPNTRLNKLTSVTKRFYNEWKDDVYNSLCERFNLDQTKKVSQLSSGMKVKYNLAVALSHNARVLILDEPTSGLDPISRDEVLDIFKMLVKNKERSILFSTHITSDLDKCADHIVYIKNGEIIADKSKNDFENYYRFISGKQSELDKIKDKVISYKMDGEKFSALIKTEDAKGLKDGYSVTTPDLETIMIYNERENSNEEFII